MGCSLDKNIYLDDMKNIFVVVNLVPWHGQAIFQSKRDRLSSSVECRIRTLEVWDTKSPADWMLTHKPRIKQKLLRIKQKLKLDSPSIWWTSIQHLSSLSVGFRTWLWRYTCLLLSILMLWHRRAIFESKGYKLPSSAEYRIRPLRVWDTKVMKCTDATVEVWEWMSYFTPQISGHVLTHRCWDWS